MKKLILGIVFAVLVSMSFSSCKEEKTRLNQIEEKLEDQSDDLKGASKDIRHAAVNMEDALNNFKEALSKVENPEDRAEIRQRVNEMFDEMKEEINQ